MIAITGRTTPLLADFGRTKAGLTTVGYELLNADGSVRAARTHTGVVHVAGGVYRVLATLPAAWDGMVLWDTGEAEPIYAAEDLTVAALDDLDVPVSSRATLDQLGAVLADTTVNVVGPVTSTNNVVLIAGDDYRAADGRALAWEDISGSRWPTITGATVVLEVMDPQGPEEFEAAGVVVKGTGEHKRITVDIAGSATEPWVAKRTIARYRLLATLADASKVTLANGDLTIIPGHGPA